MVESSGTIQVVLGRATWETGGFALSNSSAVLRDASAWSPGSGRALLVMPLLSVVCSWTSAGSTSGTDLATADRAWCWSARRAGSRARWRRCIARQPTRTIESRCVGGLRIRTMTAEAKPQRLSLRHLDYQFSDTTYCNSGPADCVFGLMISGRSPGKNKRVERIRSG